MRYKYKYILDASHLVQYQIAVESLISKLSYQINKKNEPEDSFASEYKRELEKLLIETDFTRLNTLHKPEIE
jgi:hypothetical protein